MNLNECLDVQRSARRYPAVINMNSVAGEPSSSGHDIAIVGFRANGYKIADPDEPTRNGAR
ncbi:hypothetical protein GCM10022204_09940 [Microlunatus aurantiacus]|uniref:Uncharacterized protein n=1 Tax=Microlunatus aurantiacus TaxID=446786 RepID=A0ABP7CTI2_9ACTN